MAKIEVDPEDLKKKLDHWYDCEEPNIGWCLKCDGPIRSELELIPGTNEHICEEARRQSLLAANDPHEKEINGLA